jgi:serine protease
MSFGTRARRWSACGGLAAIVLLASAGATAAAAAAQAAVGPMAVTAGAPPAADPYAPAYHHPYRHGAVPTRGAAARMTAWAKRHPGAAGASPAFSPAVVHGAEAASADNVSYGGGSPTDGIGVTIGDEKVYLVFYGSQWGKQTTKGGIVTFSRDPSGEARYVQELFKGLGTGNERWSGVATQYCQGVSQGTQTCPSTAPHVAYPHGGAIAGVWYDNSAKSPAQATGHRLALQAVAAATHFHNTTTGANRNASYIILSATGTDPDHYKQQGFCAWHDFTGDSALTGGQVTPPPGYGQLAFVNMPYVTDLGASCGAHFVRSGKAGQLDGVSIVVGHEYAETITDQEPPSGWIGPNDEVADACAWKQTGAGKVGLLRLPTGTFAMQGIWANNGNGGNGGCRFTEAITSTQLLRNPGFETGTLAPWTGSSPGVLQPTSSTDPAHSGAWLAVLGGGTAPQTDTLAQTVRVAPAMGRYRAATFSFWLEITTNDPAGKARDTLKVQELTTGGKVLKTLATFSNLNAAGHYVEHSFTLSTASFLGQPNQTITLKFTGAQTLKDHTTSFLIDDTALKAS